MDKLKNIIKTELKSIDKNLNALLFSEKELIYKELINFVNSPQKRIRSLFIILYLKSLGKDITSDIIEILTAGELIHNASLLHDDVIDGAKTRRGNITLGEKFSPQISVLSGDLLLALATEKLIKKENMDIIKIFRHCTQRMCEAEIKQYFLRGKIPAIEEYLEIAEGKTASLFRAMAESCALICGLDLNNACNTAVNFGILFQLKNDLDTESAKADAKNKIYTPKDILGIEKTMILTDNYLEKIRRDLEEIPDNIYKTGLEDLIRTI